MNWKDFFILTFPKKKSSYLKSFQCLASWFDLFFDFILCPEFQGPASLQGRIGETAPRNRCCITFRYDWPKKHFPNLSTHQLIGIVVAFIIKYLCQFWLFLDGRRTQKRTATIKRGRNKNLLRLMNISHIITNVYLLLWASYAGAICLFMLKRCGKFQCH